MPAQDDIPKELNKPIFVPTRAKKKPEQICAAISLTCSVIAVLYSSSKELIKKLSRTKLKEVTSQMQAMIKRLITMALFLSQNDML